MGNEIQGVKASKTENLYNYPNQNDKYDQKQDLYNTDIWTFANKHQNCSFLQ